MKRVTVELERYVPASEVFRLAAKEPGCAFLDSSLVNELGRWSILGLRPYKTLVKAVSYTHLTLPTILLV